MKFSILIANYNNGKYFKDCYESIIAQTYNDWEVVIVDDKSTDNSIQIIRNLIKDDPRFKLYENEKNYGCGYTKQSCAAFATGDILGFLDPDDGLKENALELMIKEHELNQDVALIHSKLIFCDEQFNEGTIYGLAKQIDVNKNFTNLDYAVTHFATFKKKYYIKNETINSNLKRAVDQDLYLKLSETGPFYFLNIPLYKYRIHSAGIASNNGTKALYSHLKVIAEAEKRRGITLEEEIIPYLSNKSPFLFESYLNNPRYLLGKLFFLLKQNFISRFKAL